MKIEKALPYITLVLFALSLVTYYFDNKEGEYNLNGTEFLSGLNIEKIEKIKIVDKQNREILLNKEGSFFTLANKNNYPASLKKVNDLLYKLSSLSVKELITDNADDSLLNKNQLQAENKEYSVELSNNKGEVIKSFFVGSKKGKGQYIRNANDKKVYLTEDSLWLGTRFDDYVSKDLVKINPSELEKVEVRSKDKNFSVTLNDEIQKTEEIEKKQDSKQIPSESSPKFRISPNEQWNVEEKKVSEAMSKLANISFLNPIFMNEMLVATLNFDTEVKIQDKNKLIYKLDLTEKDNKYYLKVTSLVGEIPKQFQIDSEDGKEKIKRIEEMSKSQGRSQNFNIKHGQWVYEINQDTYNKLKFWQ
jgi:hypothetical protein